MPSWPVPSPSRLLGWEFMVRITLIVIAGAGLIAGGCARGGVETSSYQFKSDDEVFSTGTAIDDKQQDVFFSDPGNGRSTYPSRHATPAYVYRGGRDPKTGRAQTQL